MGRVYRALDHVSQREVALKQLHANELSEARRKLVEALFSREYHTLARLFSARSREGRPNCAPERAASRAR